jgi:hypothetical protein
MNMLELSDPIYARLGRVIGCGMLGVLEGTWGVVGWQRWRKSTKVTRRSGGSARPPLCYGIGGLIG